MPINAELTAKTYNLTSDDDTAARVTPDGGVEVRRTIRPRDQNFPQVVIATADSEGNVTHAPDWSDHGALLEDCLERAG